MNDRQLNYMLTILREGSISKAAEVLCISQPSLSQMVRKIENEMNAEIFTRYSNPISLTPAGEYYIKAAHDILNIEENLSRAVHEIAAGSRGTLKIGIPVLRAMEIIPQVYPRFHEKYPNVKLELIESGSDRLENQVLQKEVDLACLTTAPKINELEYILVANEETVLVAAKSTKLAQTVPAGTTISIMDAAREKFIYIKKGHSVRITQDRLFAAFHLRPERLFATGSIEVAKRSLSPCSAVMLCPKNYIDMSPELYDVCVTYPVKEITQERHFYICRRQDQYLNSYVRDFIRILKPDYDAKP
ncbi:LysR family transcriptional regulator [[Clostridium] aminophilum]|uniref:LysR family transcriptional regulator n=1 Tax=[Clostridium] aminophilum TaxID=1526 RepID=UPI003F9A3144